MNHNTGLNGWRWKRFWQALAVVAPLFGPIGVIIGASALVAAGYAAKGGGIDWSTIPLQYRAELQAWHDNILVPLVEDTIARLELVNNPYSQEHRELRNQINKEYSVLKVYYEYQKLQAPAGTDVYIQEQKALAVGILIKALEKDYIDELGTYNPYNLIVKNTNPLAFNIVGNQYFDWANPGLNKAAPTIIAKYNAFVEAVSLPPNNMPPPPPPPPPPPNPGDIGVVNPPVKPPIDGGGTIKPTEPGYDGSGINPGTTVPPNPHTPALPLPPVRPPYAIPTGEEEQNTSKTTIAGLVIAGVLATILIFKKKKK